MSTWLLNYEEFHRTAKRVRALNDRAVKRGFTGRIEISGHEVTRTQTLPGGFEIQTVWIETSVTGQAPCYGGWRFLAAVDALPAADPDGRLFVVRYAPGAPESSVDRSALKAGWCDHCRTTRARKRIYVVQSEDGATMQVGSTCIKDFTGWEATPVFLSEQDAKVWGPGVTPSAWTVETVLRLALGATRKYGFVPASDDARRPTKAVVLDVLTCQPGYQEVLREIASEISDGEVESMTTTLRESLGDSGDYEQNLAAALSATSVNWRQVGLLASAPAAYERIIAGRVERAARAQRPQSQWIGAPGDKVAVCGVVKTCRAVDGYMPGSTKILLVVETPEGVVKVVGTSAWLFDDDVVAGATVQVNGTVKGHAEYRETKQTTLIRTSGRVVEDGMRP